MKNILKKLPVRILLYILTAIFMISTVLSFCGILYVTSSEVSGKSEEQIYSIYEKSIADNYGYYILSNVTYGYTTSNGINTSPTFAGLDIPFMEYKIMYSHIPITYPISNSRLYTLYASDGYNSLLENYSSGIAVSDRTDVVFGSVLGGNNYGYEYELVNFGPHGVTAHSWPVGTDTRTYVVVLYQMQSQYLSDQEPFLSATNYARRLSFIDRYSTPVFVVSVLVFYALLSLLVVGSGDKLKFIHRVPLIIYLGIMGAIEVGFVAFLVNVFNYTFIIPQFAFRNGMMLCALLASIVALILLFVVCNITTRIKSKQFFKTTLLHYIWVPIKRFFGFLSENTPILVKVIAGAILLTIVQIFIVVPLYAVPVFGLILAIVYKICVVLFLVKIIADWKNIKDGIARITKGDSSTPISTTKMLPEFRKHAESINNIGDGIQAAVTERMKSERMKTELITNVSHDIKTPITSIINYVDLLSKHEGTGNDKETREYLDVLNRQSSRLKKLVEDLIEASKASSGAIEMNIESVNAKVILSQSVAEFSSKLEEKKLDLIMNEPEDDVLVKADGRYLWRVIDNLMNNICKYSMEGSRVYVDIKEDGGRVHICFKNMSAVPLNISASELTERFVRGDSSRNTEGSGLGLSIASSMTELMGGTLDLAIDGDLFKATLNFTKA